MYFLLNLAITTAVIFVIAHIHAGVYVKNIWTALLVAFLTTFVTTILAAALAWMLLISGALNMLTIILYAYISPLITLLLTVLVLKLIDKWLDGFELKNLKAAFVLSLAVTVALALVGLLKDEDEAEYAKLDKKATTEQVYHLS